jgi:ABC-type uncharacterized transport system substrate-binding protein
VGSGWSCSKEAVPKLARVAFLHEQANPNNVLELKEVQTAAGPDGLYVPGSTLMRANEKRIIGLALKSRLPSVYGNRQAVDAGGLMYYGADEADSYRRVAYFVDRILKGAKPADLPVEQPMKFEFVINLQTAKKIGLTIPPELLARASKIIR